MLLSGKKKRLRNISIFEISYEERNGIPIVQKDVPQTRSGRRTFRENYERFIIPDSYHLFQTMSEQILNSKFKKIQRVSPLDANCIIRVFQKKHFEYRTNEFLNLYGALCFVKKGYDWITNSRDSVEPFALLHYVFPMVLWISDNEEVNLDADFIDFYVKVR